MIIGKRELTDSGRGPSATISTGPCLVTEQSALITKVQWVRRPHLTPLHVGPRHVLPWPVLPRLFLLWHVQPWHVVPWHDWMIVAGISAPNPRVHVAVPQYQPGWAG